MCSPSRYATSTQLSSSPSLVTRLLIRGGSSQIHPIPHGCIPLAAQPLHSSHPPRLPASPATWCKSAWRSPASPSMAIDLPGTAPAHCVLGALGFETPAAPPCPVMPPLSSNRLSVLSPPSRWGDSCFLLVSTHGLVGFGWVPNDMSFCNMGGQIWSQMGFLWLLVGAEWGTGNVMFFKLWTLHRRILLGCYVVCFVKALPK
jgi:hypothetical protein